MAQQADFLQRIAYQGVLSDLIQIIAGEFQLGDVVSHEIIEVGYEDLNIKVTTSQDSYLIKIFGSFRDEENATRYIEIMDQAVKKGVPHPKLHLSKNGGYLYQYDAKLMACVMDYIEGKSFYELHEWPTKEEAKMLIHAVSNINLLDIKVPNYYDEWSPVNFLKEFKEKGKYIKGEDYQRIEQLVAPFNTIQIDQLRWGFAHSDVIRPNVLKDVNSKLYIIDFSVSSYKPIVQELAVLLCGMFFNENDTSRYSEYYQLILDEYRPKLSKFDREAFPIFVKAVFAMFLMLGTYNKVTGKIVTKENEYWIKLGKIGLKYVSRDRRSKIKIPSG